MLIVASIIITQILIFLQMFNEDATCFFVVDLADVDFHATIDKTEITKLIRQRD